eukprot:gb/GEZJ01002514.1/.p3 GENE.gb/GEZJ01002514.1/~~gb/GEZJ01002514.1/.p3  ORF type:complete len:156 (-),score=23.92 gb/GEZJ01002514.1/:3593-4060(-)
MHVKRNVESHFFHRDHKPFFHGVLNLGIALSTSVETSITLDAVNENSSSEIQSCFEFDVNVKCSDSGSPCQLSESQEAAVWRIFIFMFPSHEKKFKIINSRQYNLASMSSFARKVSIETVEWYRKIAAKQQNAGQKLCIVAEFFQDEEEEDAESS